MGKVKAYKIWQSKDEPDKIILQIDGNITNTELVKIVQERESIGYENVSGEMREQYRFMVYEQKGQNNESGKSVEM